MRTRKPVILVIEPENSLRKLMQSHLTNQGYEVLVASDGTEALAILDELFVDLIISAKDISGVSVNELCRAIRLMSDVPFMVLSVHATEDEKVSILDLGADDFIIKPFGMGEFLARIRVALRHGERNIHAGIGIYDFQDISIDLWARHVKRNGSTIPLTPTEFSLLSVLVRNAGKILTHRYILDAVWGPPYCDDREYLRAFIYHLRKKIERDPHSPELILGVSGVGYQFSAGVLKDECPTCHRPFNQSTNGSSQGTRLVAVNP